MRPGNRSPPASQPLSGRYTAGILCRLISMSLASNNMGDCCFGLRIGHSELYFSKTAQVTLANPQNGALVSEAYVKVNGVIDLKETLFTPGYMATTEYPYESDIKISVGESVFAGNMQCQEHQETGTPFIRCFLVQPMQQVSGTVGIGAPMLDFEYLEIYPPNRSFSGDIAYVNERKVDEYSRGNVYPKGLLITSGGGTTYYCGIQQPAKMYTP